MRRLWFIVAMVSAAGASAVADEPALDSKFVARRLLECTVTVRISASPSADSAQAVQSGVSVSSGVSLGHGLIVTFNSDAQARCRVTLPNGEQAEARLAVVDSYSRLSLLSLAAADLPGLELADEVPPTGAVILTAAAEGIEKPSVSQGILGGADRLLGESGLPPLLQCDVRTTATSPGAAVVDRKASLLGIVAATPDPRQNGGWTYAVPASHVRRLLQSQADGRLVVLRRERPSIGVTFGAGAAEGVVKIDRVTPDSPAAKAGIAAGDVVLQADGRRIRSAYQAVALVLRKQPGDKIELVVQNAGVTRNVAIVLGNALDAPPGGVPDTRVQVGPQVQARAAGPRQIELNSRRRFAEVAVQPAEADAQRLPRDEASLLRAQLEAFGKVIERLQAELARRDESQQKTDELIRSLSDEVTRLRKQLQSAQEP